MTELTAHPAQKVSRAAMTVSLERRATIEGTFSSGPMMRSESVPPIKTVPMGSAKAERYLILGSLNLPVTNLRKRPTVIVPGMPPGYAKTVPIPSISLTVPTMTGTGIDLTGPSSMPARTLTRC